MDIFRRITDELVRFVSGAPFFKKPIKFIYLLNGIFAFLPAVYFLIAIIGKMRMLTLNLWSTILFYIAILLSFSFLMALGLFGFFFWKNRSKDLDVSVGRTDKVKAIPICAHIVKSFGEWLGISLFVAPLALYMIFYVLLLFSGFGPFVSDVPSFFAFMFGGLLLFPFLALILFLIAYPIVFIANLISEKLMIKALVANNVSDIGDIHRAALVSSDANGDVSSF